MWSRTYRVAPITLVQDSSGKITKQRALMLPNWQAAKGLGRGVGRGEECEWVTAEETIMAGWNTESWEDARGCESRDVTE